MPKAKTIDRLEFTKRRTRLLRTEERLITDKPEVITCPECGAELIHEAGCLRCLCGWSKC
mgnify:CR=1 FL=1